MSSNSVGLVLKALRKERKLTLKNLAELSNVSISFLSQVERGKSSVTLESLKRIADALEVNPSVFFSKDDLIDDLAMRRQKFHYKDLSDGISDAHYFPILVTLQPGENEGNALSHGGHEFILVIEGTLAVNINGEEENLSVHQSIMFDAKKVHYWYNRTNQPVRFLVVSSK